VPGGAQVGVFQLRQARQIGHHAGHVQAAKIGYFVGVAAVVLKRIDGLLPLKRLYRLGQRGPAGVAVDEHTGHRGLSLGGFGEAHAHGVAQAVFE
jgi:hypothetical protein